MAVFLSNVCTFNECGLKFASLSELIRHIEDHHLDDSFDPSTPAICLPVSRILRIFASSSEDEFSAADPVNPLSEPRLRKPITSPAASLSTTPTGSEMDEDAGFESDSGQGSVDSSSWNVDSANSFIKLLKSSNISSPHQESLNKSIGKKRNDGRIYKCDVPNCMKTYRSGNSLSHHRRSVHKISGGIAKSVKPIDGERKIYKCVCGKTYKTSHGLKNHSNIHHNPNQMENGALPPAQDFNSSNNLAIIQNMNTLNGVHPETNPSHVTQLVGINGTTNVNLDANMQTEMKEPLTGSVAPGSILKNSEIVTDNSCSTVSPNIEITCEPKPSILNRSPSVILAPTLQQHLLSPIIPKVTSST